MDKYIQSTLDLIKLQHTLEKKKLDLKHELLDLSTKKKEIEDELKNIENHYWYEIVFDNSYRNMDQRKAQLYKALFENPSYKVFVDKLNTIDKKIKEIQLNINELESEIKHNNYLLELIMKLIPNDISIVDMNIDIDSLKLNS